MSTDSSSLATSAVLYAAARDIAKNCAQENIEFVKCKSVDENPAKCLKEGEKVQNCVLELLKTTNAKCPTEFLDYSKCLDRQSAQEYVFDRCRNQQFKFENCTGNGSAQSATVATSPKEDK